MLVELPKDIDKKAMSVVTELKPGVVFTAVADGIMMFAANGKLVGQVTLKNGEAKVTVADASSYLVNVQGNNVSVRPYSEIRKNPRYEIFGNVKGYCYSVYEYEKGKIAPELAATVTESIAVDNKYKINVSENANIYRMVLISCAISMLQRGA